MLEIPAFEISSIFIISEALPEILEILAFEISSISSISLVLPEILKILETLEISAAKISGLPDNLQKPPGRDFQHFQHF